MKRLLQMNEEQMRLLQDRSAREILGKLVIAEHFIPELSKSQIFYR